MLKVADLVLDPTTHRVTRAGQAINLTPKEYTILGVLMRHAGDPVTRTKLTESVWETDADSLFNTLEAHVSNLRKKFDVAGAAPLIHTVRGYGYLVDHRPESRCP